MNSVEATVKGILDGQARIAGVRESYSFRETWTFDAPRDPVYEALARPVDYPLWWRQFTRVEVTGDDRCEMVVRSFLPYEVKYLLVRQTEDPLTGVLEGRVEGDIHGTIRWEVQSTDTGGCRVLFAEDVSTTEWFMNLFAPIVKPLFIWNHRLMMESGRSGLRGFLAGYALAKADPQAFRSI